MYKVHCLNNISAEGLAVFTDEYELVDDIAQADAVLVRSADMHEMELPANLKGIARAGAGVNNIPLQKCADAGIAVFNTPGANANAVKELVLAGMLLAARDIVGGIEWVKENAADANVGKAAEKAKKAFAGGEIFGKTLGVIGLGAIGAKVVAAAEALGMKVVGYDPFVDAERAAAISADMTFVTDLADLYPACDYVTIHVPALKDTVGMVNAEAIAQMKDGVVFLNFSRDTLVDDAAMRLCDHPRSRPERHRRHGERRGDRADEGRRRVPELLARHAGRRCRHGRRSRSGQGRALRDRLRQSRRGRDAACDRDAAPGRIDQGGRGQLRQDGRPFGHGLP